MSSLKRIESHFEESIRTKVHAQEVLAVSIEQAGALLVNCLKNKGKIFSCGNGGSSCDAVHFAAELVNRFERDRPPLAAICLNTDTASITSISNDFNYDLIFSKQLSALAQESDILLAISTSGNSKNILEAIAIAKLKKMPIIALTGSSGGKLRALLGSNDIELCVPSIHTPRIQEVHILIIHCLCDYIDEQLFPVN
jgi:phosphoheptose isomerase